MKVIGLFRELDPEIGQTAPSIHEAVGKLPMEQVDDVASYLDAGIPVFDVMGASRDPLDASVWISGGESILTDGCWIWRADCAHLVRQHRIELPEDFILKAVSSDGSTPDFDVVKGLEAVLLAYAEQGGPNWLKGQTA